MSDLIKVGFCVAYDWPLLANALPLIYDHADSICLSMDRDRITWANAPIQWDANGFNELIRRLDPQNKVTCYEDDFHQPDLTPMQNEVRQRNKMAEFMGTSGWHI